MANAILKDWIFVYSVPSNIISDGGREFANDLQKTLWQQLAVNYSTTTPYHPQCNRQAEVFNKTMVTDQRKVIDQAK